MVFAAGLGYRYLIGLALCAIPVVLSLAMGAAYRRRRLLAFLNPRADPQSTGYPGDPVAHRGRRPAA